MKNTIVRIESIEIRNFKNVRFGKLSFENNRKSYKSSILGLYGQNGSGKTALIDAMALLKFALTMQSAPKLFADFIHVDAEYATLKYEFKVTNHDSESEYTVFYEFKLRKDIEDTLQPQEYIGGEAVRSKAVIFDEVLSYSYKCRDQKVKLLPVVDTRTEEVFIPTTKYEILVGKEKSTETDLLVAKKYAAETSRSFVFSKELLNAMRKQCKTGYHLDLFENLFYFGSYELFIIDTSNSGLITLNTLPLAFNYVEKGKTAIGSLMIQLNRSSLIPKEALSIVCKVIDNMNIVLKQLVPGLTIGVKDLGTELFPNGNMGNKIQLISRKNSKEIPLRYESEGIKKIISILQLLIVIYNKSSITVAVDEIDSGVFEYLLGELLRIISEKGKGQLVFTSHNLRPLETLDRGFIAFTTTNPENRYIRMSNVKTNNNLRDFYYRDIVLGEQSEVVYEPTNNYEIALAFREAGELSGS
ncbi:MAG: AAA family ATPase [Lachnospiraceae bacterium]|nr:AAA family ATPase [Lachnospiraceae bacterium]